MFKGGRFGKYGDLKRKIRLRESRLLRRALAGRISGRPSAELSIRRKGKGNTK